MALPAVAALKCIKRNDHTNDFVRMGRNSFKSTRGGDVDTKSKKNEGLDENVHGFYQQSTYEYYFYI